MLKLFEVTGFKNFENTIRLNFSDIRDYKFNNFCIVDGLLSKLIVYGKNSVGKSNLGLALFDIVSHLTTNNVTPGLYDYYLNVNNKAGYAEFHYVFLFDSVEVDIATVKVISRFLFMNPLQLTTNVFSLTIMRTIKVT